MKQFFKQDQYMNVLYVLFVVFTGWWLFLLGERFSVKDHNLLFAATYGSVALYGGICGFSIASHWGGWRSVFGRAILFMSLGLLAAEFGQIAFSYYNIVLKDEIPYPSIADLGFFANVPLYSLGMYNLAKVAGVQFSLKRLSHALQVIVIPLIMLGISYVFFIKDYTFDASNPLKTFLDFGYPLGQVIYVSIALLTYSLTKNTLGGVMRNKILFLILAFVTQYVADYNFLYQTLQGTWVNGGYGDFLYFLAYCFMTLGILQIRNVLKIIRAK